ncbi:hypothetical protein HY485_00925 [Candidatus Woesearchaeota archaeon]|nr:hypothetical protein [Candidatus Woesearchaeota archaeon]
MVRIINPARTIDDNVRIHYQDFASSFWIIGLDGRRKINYGANVRETTAKITDVFEGPRTTSSAGAKSGSGEYKGIHLALRCDCCRRRTVLTYENHQDIADLIEDLKTLPEVIFLTKPEEFAGKKVLAYYLEDKATYLGGDDSCGLCLGIAKPRD